jgi:ketosteroid isomerase-like protein
VYHAIVRRIARRNFELVNDRDFETLLASCDDRIHHRFGGDHALGGERHDKEALRRWFERLVAVTPTLRLHVDDVWVSGGPWNTVATIRWRATAELPDGGAYRNHGVHIVRMRWGRAVEIDANEDSQAVAAALQQWGAAGATEAFAAPITS